jgi:fructose-1,6-bisphosphatase/inositol monophosphatase family enzyme
LHLKNVMTIDHDTIEKILRDVAALSIVPRFQKLARGEVREKGGPEDLVTIADEEAELELAKRLQELLPGSVVLGEEAVAQGAVSRDILKTSAGPVWVVDPVDGTYNFAHGVPKFGTILALVHKGECVAGWIYQIPADRMIAGEKGKGVRINGVPYIRPSYAAAAGGFGTMRAYIATGFFPPPVRAFVETKTALVADASPLRCCAWEYPALLEGEAVFSIYGRLEPWDHLAGAMLLEEAGFYVRKWDGSPYRPGDSAGGIINAPSPELWGRVYDTFLKDGLSGSPGL